MPEKKTNHSIRVHVGMRMIKTVLAVILCAVIGLLRKEGDSVFFAMIAALICMQNSAEQTLQQALNRTVATIIGGIFGVTMLYIAVWTDLQRYMFLYYLIISLLLIPIIQVTLLVRMPATSVLSCVTFLSIAVYHITDASLFTYALNRIMDTLIGIVVALAINFAIPYRPTIEAELSDISPLVGEEPELRAPPSKSDPDAGESM